MTREWNEQKDGIAILNVSGVLTLRSSVLRAMAGGSTRILLDLNGITRIDSFGIGELVAAYTSIVRAGGQIRLLRVLPRVKYALEVTKLCMVFEVFDDEASAVHSFGEPEPLHRKAASVGPGSEMFYG